MSRRKKRSKKQKISPRKKKALWVFPIAVAITFGFSLMIKIVLNMDPTKSAVVMTYVICVAAIWLGHTGVQRLARRKS